MIIESFIYEQLSAALTVPVYTELPDNAPHNCVVIEKTGGGESNTIRTAMVAVQAYGSTRYEAAKINEDVRAAMFALAERNEICRVELNSDYNFPDQTRKRNRYQSVWDITYY